MLISPLFIRKLFALDFHADIVSIVRVSRIMGTLIFTRRSAMVTGIVLVNAKRSKLDSVVKSLTEIDGITEVYTVAGEYDLVAMIRVKDNKQLSDIVAKHMTRNVDGIKYTKNPGLS